MEGTAYHDLAHACAIKATLTAPDQKDALKMLVDSETFVKDTMMPGEISTPVMEIFKVQAKSDGSLNKLKTHFVVRGDLQDKNIIEDKWSLTASFRLLKMFLAHASHLKKTT